MIENYLTNYDARVGELTELALADNSSGYDIDVFGIYTDGERFSVLSASGCSCWDGDGEEFIFDTFEELEAYLLGDMDNTPYYMSLNSSMSLIAEAKAKLGR